MIDASTCSANSSSSSSWISTSTSRPTAGREFVKRQQLVLVERRGDQQHAVGTHDPSVEHVALADGEVLAQDRQRARLRARPAGRRPSRRSAARPSAPTGSLLPRARYAWATVAGSRSSEQVTLRRRSSLDLSDHGQIRLGSQRPRRTPRAGGICWRLGHQRIDRTAIRCGDRRDDVRGCDRGMSSPIAPCIRSRAAIEPRRAERRSGREPVRSCRGREW